MIVAVSMPTITTVPRIRRPAAPEPWEAEALFDETASREKRERRLEVDSTEPSIFGRDAAEAVAIAYALPGWD